MTKYVNFAELSRIAGIEYGNAKHYRKTFPEYIVHKARQNGRKLYDPETAGVLSFIAESYARKETATTIREALSRKISAVYEVEPDDFGKTETLRKSGNDDAIFLLVQAVNNNTEMIKQFSEMRKENDQLRRENDQLKTYIRELEGKKALESASKSKKWWKLWK